MPLILPHLPSAGGIRLISQEHAGQQEIRPLRIQVADPGTDGELLASWLALLSNTPLQIEIILGASAVAGNAIDGILAWDAALPPLPAGVPALLIGEAARAWLTEVHRIPVEHLTHPLAEVLPQRLVGDHHPLITAQEPVVDVPIARTWRFGIEAISRVAGLDVLGHSPRSGVHLVHEVETGRLAVLTQLAWSPLGFARESRRLVAIDDLAQDTLPEWTWRSHVHLLVASWLDLAVYQPASFLEKP